MGVPLNTEVLFPLHKNLVCTICQALLERFGIIGGKLIFKKKLKIKKIEKNKDYD